MSSVGGASRSWAVELICWVRRLVLVWCGLLRRGVPAWTPRTPKRSVLRAPDHLSLLPEPDPG